MKFCASEEEAEQVVESFKVYRKVELTTLGQAADDLMALKKNLNLRPATIATLKIHLKFLTDAFGSVPLGLLGRTDVEHWLRVNKLAVSTKRKCAVIANELYRRAEISSPFRDQELLQVKEDKPEIEFYTVAQVKELLRKCPRRRLATLVLGLFAGLRPREAERFLESGQTIGNPLRIPAATSKGREARLVEPPETFYTWIQHCPMNSTNIRRDLDGMKIDLSFPWIKDGLRHTCATYLLAVWDSGDVSRLLGHKNSYTLYRHYAGLTTKAEAHKFLALDPREILGANRSARVRRRLVARPVPVG